MAESFLPKLEEDVLAFWKREGIFEQSLKRPAPRGRFVFYEGPPYANGVPGVHHMLSRAYKDAVARYKTMRGFHVGRRAGWDTHGLPVEMAVEKLLGVKSKREIEQFGVEKFIAECRKNVFAMKGEWEQFTERMGYWLDLQDAYVTMTPEYIESCWWIFKQISDRGLLYEDFKVVPFCTRCGTALSSHEMAQGYKEVEDHSVFVKFELVDEPGTFVLAWTTTPWTLPGNVALAVDPKMYYVRTAPNEKGERFIIARERMPYVLGAEMGQAMTVSTEIAELISGDQLIGRKYKPLFDFLDLGKETGKVAYKIVAGDFVTTDEGTGVVHTAVMYGADDFALGTKLDLPKKHTVNPDGTFNELVKPWQGQYVKDETTEKAIMKYLKDNHKLYKQEPVTHDYPFCWRCDTPLLYYAKDSWFFKTTAVKKELLKANQTINWVPSYLKDGRFGEWLSNVVDWAISRERYWGIPLPIWECQGGGRRALGVEGKPKASTSTHHSPPTTHQVIIGSFDELRKHATTPIPDDFDPHRPGIDAIVLKCPKCGGNMRRVTEVADVWFDSGCMPFAQWHYPFENRELIDSGEQYPADFISEGIDQTRGWFYTLLAVATLLGRPAPYKNVISLGLVNDAEGKKMSKRLGNLILPKELFPRFGSDAVRFSLYTMSQAGDFKNFDLKGVDTVVKKTFLILWNVRSFYQLHAHGRPPSPAKPEHLLDRWVLARLNRFVTEMTSELEQYGLTTAGRQLAAFVTELSTWYVRRSRDRFRGEERDAAVATLGLVLETVAKLLAPLSPMVAEQLYRDVQGSAQSVHLTDWPQPLPAHADEALLALMDRARSVVETGHALRKDAGIRLRQPLPQLVFVGERFPDEVAAVVADELNVKEVHSAKKLPTGNEWHTLEGEGASIVSLDTTVTDELKIEGIERELVRNLSALRKAAKLTRADRIIVTAITQDDTLRAVIEQHREQLKRAVGAVRIELVEAGAGTPVRIDGAAVTLSIERVSDGAA
ncbi:MAG: isoleucine--tRNA ligase [Candidatus Kerfeldbacteria bacterium]|nr:isoleucine--tRNA ligase [Candidatus Kerfeldbacteria bacterium]